MSQEDREQRRPYSTANFQRGYYKQQDISNYEVNTDALLTYHEQLGSALRPARLGGGQYYEPPVSGH